MAVEGQATFMYQENRRQFNFVVTDEDAAGSPPRDLTGVTVKWVLAKFDRDGLPVKSNPLLAFSSDDLPTPQVIVPNPSGGEVQVFVKAEDTRGFKAPLDYYFELEGFEGGTADGAVVFATGTISMRRNVDNQEWPP